MDVIYENKTNLIEFNCSSILGETMHLHKEIEIVYAISGQSMAYADKNGYLLNPGDTFIAFPNQIHYYETIERGEYMVLIFSSVMYPMIFSLAVFNVTVLLVEVNFIGLIWLFVSFI